MIGRVVSTKMSKTVVVLVEGRKTHPLYKKTFVQSKKYLVDNQLEIKMGDIVEIEKTRPLSKRKHWQVKKILGQDIIALGEEALKEEANKTIAEVLPEGKESEERAGDGGESVETAEKIKQKNKKQFKKRKEELH